MNYPTRLLPKSNYKTIQWTDDLLPLFLVRHTPSKELFMLDTNKINTDNLKIQSDHLRDFSTNLLGYFTKEDLNIEIQDKVKREFYYEIWNEGDGARIPKFNEDFCIDENRGCFFIKVGEIISKQFVCNNAIDNQQYHLHFKILHTPTKCNFWHFSIRVFDINNKEISSLTIKDRLIKKFWKEAKEHLVECVSLDNPNINKLDSKHYLKH